MLYLSTSTIDAEMQVTCRKLSSRVEEVVKAVHYSSL